MSRPVFISCPVCHKGYEGNMRNMVRLGYKWPGQELKFDCVACGCNVIVKVDWLPKPPENA